MRTTADVCRRSFLVHARGSGGDADIRAARDDRGRPRADGGDDRARAARIQLCQGDDVVFGRILVNAPLFLSRLLFTPSGT
jgi:hypothetical protein